MKKSSEGDYLAVLRERTKTSRVYKEHQGVGLVLSEILGDKEHISLYMKLAKEYDSEKLVALAKDIADRKLIQNKGAYFMSLLKNIKKNSPR